MRNERLKTLGVAIAMLLATLFNIGGLHALRLKAESKLAEATLPSPPRDTIRRAVLLFGGDWMQHKPQVEAARRDTTFDYTPSIRYIAPLFQEADVAVVNFETTLTRRPYYTGYPLFRSPHQMADALRDAGIDIALLANNHCCDGGRTGLRTTIEELERCGIRHTGAFIDSSDYACNRILHFECDSLRFALLNYTYGTNGMPVPKGSRVHRLDTVAMAADLAQIDRSTTDCVIACLHWGIEYERKPNREQRRIRDFLRRRGVELIIGSHPHVIQPLEADSLGVVAWSLGNLVSNQQKRYTDGGLLLRIAIEKRGEAPCRFSTKAIPFWVHTPDYAMLPHAVADTLPMAPHLRQRCHLFFEDTRQLLGIDSL